MWYVYIIRSINFPKQEYIGATSDLKRRLPEHNTGKSTHTAKFKPWNWSGTAPFQTNTKHWRSRNISSPIPAGHLRTSGSDA
jgi:predicted GIY-YIG superfamily endonuclease